MPKQMLTVPEILAMMEVVEVPAKMRDRFEKQATAVLTKRPAFTDADDQFEVGSGYGARTHEGHVNFKTGTVEHQLTVAKAQEIAFMLLKAAEAAIGDAMVMTLLRDRVGITDPQRLGAILIDLREIRQGSRDTVYPQ